MEIGFKARARYHHARPVPMSNMPDPIFGSEQVSFSKVTEPAEERGTPPI